MPFEVGQFVSDYEILGVLGQGGMGAVYRARNIISNRVEALKVLLADVASQAELSDRFVSEIRTLAQLDHPNIAKFHTAFKAENQLIMSMEFVEGFTLADLARQGTIPVDQVVSYISQTLSALGCAHALGITHRDVKPSNIMVTSHGVTKLMDFGIAKSNLDANLTRPGTTMGSMLYMSPEQVRGTEVDARSDLYSLGIVLYELTAGKRPFEAENTFAILDAHLNAAPRPPIEVNPQLPATLNEIILIAIQKEPGRRFQSAAAFSAALDSFRQRPAAAVSAQDLPATAPLTVAANATLPKRNRALWLVAAAIACVCVLGAAEYTRRNYFHSAAPAVTAAPSGKAVAAPIATAPPVTAPLVVVPPVSQPTMVADTTPPPTGHASHVKEAVVRTMPAAAPPSVMQAVPAVQTTQVPVTQAPVTQAAAARPGPSQEDLDKAQEDLMKLRSRAEAVRGSLNTLRSQQAAQGVGLRSDMTSAESRMNSYLQAADVALQTGRLDFARKSMDHAEEDLSKLEHFLGH